MIIVIITTIRASTSVNAYISRREFYINKKTNTFYTEAAETQCDNRGNI